MLKDNAAAFVELGEQLASTQLIWSLHAQQDEATGRYVLNEQGKDELRAELSNILGSAKRLKLPTSMRLIGRRLSGADSLPQTVDEFLVISEVLQDELASKLFLFVPADRAPYWEKDDLLSDKTKAAFPKAAAELRGAGNAYAAALPEGTVFYSMRAVEHGLRAFAADVELTFDVQQWGNIIDEIESKIKGWSTNGIPGMAKADKDERLQFLSAAAKEFTYFKDGWRNYVAHAKVPYTEGQALTVLNHVVDFIERLSDSLKE